MIPLYLGVWGMCMYISTIDWEFLVFAPSLMKAVPFMVLWPLGIQSLPRNETDIHDHEVCAANHQIVPLLSGPSSTD